MIKTLQILILVLGLIISTTAYSIEEDFEPFPAIVDLNATTYFGLLMDEEEYKRYIKLESEYNLLLDKYSILEEAYNKQDIKFNDLVDLVDSSLDKIVEVSKPTFWERNKGWINLGIGIVIGITTSIIIYKVID